ncbi:unnamed protein product, partial [Calicophoron daubneyi]
LTIEGLVNKLAPNCTGVSNDRTECIENLTALVVADKQFGPSALRVQLHTNVTNENLEPVTGSLFFVRNPSGDERTALKSRLVGLYGNALDVR